MAELKTKANDASVEKFIKDIKDERRREDCLHLLEIMGKATKVEPRMWGTSIIGFGDYHFKYESGREGDWFLAGFSPRKQNITLYILGGFEPYTGILAKLGKYSTGKGCLYIKKLADVDTKALKELVRASVQRMKTAKT